MKSLDLAIAELDGDLYHRGLNLVEVVASKSPSLLPEGTPSLRTLTPAALRLRVDQHVQCVQWVQPQDRAIKLALARGLREPDPWWKPRKPPRDDLVLPMLAYGRWKHVRAIAGVVEAPFLRPDGTIWQDAGYDDGTGYLYRPNATFPRVPEQPTQDDARRALASLRHVFCDFPYVSEAASGVPIACLLTILARSAISGCVPCFAFEASVQGSGKTKQGDCVALIATGRVPPHANFPEDESEQSKRALSMALSGAPVCFLDNVKGTFGGSVLEALVTSSELRQRLLGGNEDVVVPWLATILVTGNNMRPTEDMARRMLVCRIEPDVEDPTRGRAYQHHPLIPWVQAERERLIIAALTILRAYACHGYPDAGTGTMESFDEWSRLIPHAIVFSGGPNVLEAVGNSEDAVDDAASALATIVQELPRLGDGRPMTARNILAALYPAPKGGPPDGWEAMREAIETLAPPRGGGPVRPDHFSRALQGLGKGRVFAGVRLDSVTRWQADNRVAGWIAKPVKPAR